MRNTLIILGLCIFAVIVGGIIYVHSYVANVPGVPAPVITENNPSKTIPIKVLDEGMQSASINQRKNYAIYDSGQFQLYWARAHGDSSSAPIVDFSKNYVIAVFAGTEPTGGYKIGVADITDQGTSRSVRVVITKPGPDCDVVEETTSPYQFVQVPNTDATALTHTDELESTTCR